MRFALGSFLVGRFLIVLTCFAAAGNIAQRRLDPDQLELQHALIGIDDRDPHLDLIAQAKLIAFFESC